MHCCIALQAHSTRRKELSEPTLWSDYTLTRMTRNALRRAPGIVQSGEGTNRWFAAGWRERTGVRTKRQVGAILLKIVVGIIETKSHKWQWGRNKKHPRLSYGPYSAEF